MENIEITFFEYDITDSFDIDEKDKPYIKSIHGIFSTDMKPEIHGYQKYALCYREDLVFYINAPCELTQEQTQEIRELLTNKYKSQSEGYITLNIQTIKALPHTTKTITVTSK